MEPGEPRGLPVLKLVVAPFFVDVGRASRPSYLLRVTPRGTRFASRSGDHIFSSRRVQCVTSQMLCGTAFDTRA